MKKIKANDAEAQSADIVADNLSQLQSLFPEAFAEGKVQFDTLRQLLGGVVDEADEKYGLNWHGKRRARQIALTPSTGTLRPHPDESVNWSTTQNLMIEGDNLEVLKLLQKSYAGKIKMIYIDPPYNTGKDFVYPDNFRDTIGNYLELTGQAVSGTKMSSNMESSGRFHTDWLNMMYPRMRLARSLLRDDGVIFITIDDAEQSNLRKLGDEIFGEENFFANVVWQKKYAVANDDPGIGAMHDHILVWRKSETFQRGLLPRTEEQNARYSNPDSDARGEWASDNYVSNKSKDERPTLWYSIKHPRTGEDVWPDESAVWRYSADKHLEIEREGRLYWGPNQSYKKPRLKRYLHEVQQGIVPPTWWPFEDCGHNDEAQKETGALIGKKVFSTPKPIRLIDRMLAIGAPESNAIVMDFFAGSGSTGHAVMERNSIDGGSRRFVLVQLPEPLDANNKDQKVAAELCDSLGVRRSIAELTKERLRRSAKAIRDERPLFSGDLGFRVFRLDRSNMRVWSPDPEGLAQTLLDHHEHVLEGRTEADIVYEVLLKLGLDLCVPMESRSVAGKTVGAVGGGVLMLCLAEKILTKEVEMVAAGIVSWHKELAPAGDSTVVFRDSAFADDVAKTNMAAILAQNGLENVRSL